MEKALEDAQILSAKTGPSFEGRDHSVSSSWLNSAASCRETSILRKGGGSIVLAEELGF